MLRISGKWKVGGDRFPLPRPGSRFDRLTVLSLSKEDPELVVRQALHPARPEPVEGSYVEGSKGFHLPLATIFPYLFSTYPLALIILLSPLPHHRALPCRSLYCRFERKKNLCAVPAALPPCHNVFEMRVGLLVAVCEPVFTVIVGFLVRYMLKPHSDEPIPFLIITPTARPFIIKP